VPNISQVRTSRTSESAMAASFQSLDPLLQAGHPLSRGEPRPGDPRKLLVVPGWYVAGMTRWRTGTAHAATTIVRTIGWSGDD
jgi:hypothetical protein